MLIIEVLRGFKTDLNMLKQNFRPPSAVFIRGMYSAYTQIILETGVKTKDKRLFLESLHSLLDKNSVNERALFPRAYALLVSFLRSNEQWRLLLYICIQWLAEYIPLKKTAEGGRIYRFNIFRSVLNPLLTTFNSWMFVIKQFSTQTGPVWLDIRDLRTFAPIDTAHFFAHVTHTSCIADQEGKQHRVFDPRSGKGSLVASWDSCGPRSSRKCHALTWQCE